MSRILLVPGFVFALSALGCSSSASDEPATDPDAATDTLGNADSSSNDGSTAIDSSAGDSTVDDATSVDAIALDVADGSTSDAATCARCVTYGKPATLGTIPGTATPEISGITASRVRANTFYVHNDSGHGPSVFVIDDKAALLAELVLEGANVQDWEDIAVGPCPAGSCIHVGNMGDNAASRSNYVVYRVTEPTAPSGKSNVTFESLPFKYPDGKHNCETLLVHPTTGAIYVVTKTDTEKSGAYRFPMPLTPGTEATLVRVSDVKTVDGGNHLFTGGDIHPCGSSLLIRLYGELYEYELGAGAPFDGIFATTPKRVPVATEPQGEAVCYRTDGLGYYTMSEVSPKLFGVGCL